MKLHMLSLSLGLFAVVGIVACDPALEDTELLDEEIDEDYEDLEDVTFRASVVNPTVLPIPAAGVEPEYDQLMAITINGVDHDIRDLLAADDTTMPRARITGAFRTTATDDRTWYTALSEIETEAAQVYRCDGATWVFQRPEAGLETLYFDLLGNGPYASSGSHIFDHYRHPGDGTAAAGPAWRLTRRFPNLSTFTQRFVGTTASPDFVSVANPAEPTAINLLRVPSNSLGGPGASVPLANFSGNLPTGRGFLLRLGTEGGRAPASCAASENGNELRVPYSTDYYFVQLVES